MHTQITKDLVASLLPVRPEEANKGSFGRILVVAGSRTMCGAGFLCAKSALLAGAGVVFWALPQSLQPFFAARLPEVITLPLPEDEQGQIAKESFPILETFVKDKKISVTVIGPGMDNSPLLPEFLSKWQYPLVVDADALNAMGRKNVLPKTSIVIYTPHPVEMNRILHSTLPMNREEQLKEFFFHHSGVCLIKGHHTLVACSQQKGLVYENTTGGPALAKAGSGDVLAGLTVGLWAQLGMQQTFCHTTALKATLCAVYLHGLAGDIATREKTEYTVLSTDIISFLPQAFKFVKES